MVIPGCDRIQVGTLVSVNYAGYHLPPWCYFREKWPLWDKGDNKRPVQHERVTLGKLGEEETFLDRCHEFCGPLGPGVGAPFEYIRKKELLHHVSTWQKFVSDDNEELLPPTMDESHFSAVKDSFLGLLGVHCVVCKEAHQLGDMSEYQLQQLMDAYLPQLPSGPVEEFLGEVRGYRWGQERVLMEEMARRVDRVLQGDGRPFRSVQERRVRHEKRLDRLALHLVAQRMRFDVRLLEIGDVKRYLGLLREGEGEGEEGLGDILGSMERKLKNDITDAIERDPERLGDRIKGEEIDGVRDRIEKLRECLEGKEGHGYPSFREVQGELEELNRSFEELKGQVEGVLAGAGFQAGQSVSWKEYRDSILAIEEGERNVLIEESEQIMSGIGVGRVQELETGVNEIKQRVRAVERGARETEQLILKFEEKLVIKEDKQAEKKQQQQQQQQQQQEQQETKAPAETILAFKREPHRFPLEVDDLNSYLRYPPIQNSLQLHEGFWPPLRNVGSEGSISVRREDADGKIIEFEDIKLSNLIGRFDEAFTLFSSTLADHGMPRPVPEPRPIRFRYGMGEVVPAWDHAERGISDMKLGEIRIMLCPSLTGYGDRGVPESVPPFMPLLYVIRMDGIYTQEDDNYESDDDMPSDDIGSQEASPVKL